MKRSWFKRARIFIKKQVLSISPVWLKTLGLWDRSLDKRKEVRYYSEDEFINWRKLLEGRDAEKSPLFSTIRASPARMPKATAYCLPNVHVYKEIALSEKRLIVTDICKWEVWKKKIDINLRWSSFTVCWLKNVLSIKPICFDYAVIVTPHNYMNYYHFIVDFLLRLQNYHRLADDLQVQPTFVATAPLSQFHKAYFEILGIDVKQHRSFYTHNLMVASRRRFGYSHSSESIKDLRSLLLEKLSISDAKPYRRIYISRDRARTRSVKNEVQLMRCLADKGFEKYRLEDLSVAEQICLFSESAVVVSPHGAGLANIIFSARPNLVELFPSENAIWGHYASLCLSLGGVYESVSGRSHSWEGFCVDVDQVERAVDSALKIRKSGSVEERVFT